MVDSFCQTVLNESFVWSYFLSIKSIVDKREIKQKFVKNKQFGNELNYVKQDKQILPNLT